MIEAFLLSTGVVALAEIGDKTQLLALLLAARFRRPWPIVAGIAVATLLNHAAAGALGAWITQQLSPLVLRWVMGLGFLAMAVWALIPDRIEDDEGHIGERWGVFGATAVSFFIAEIGDKTQLATVALAAQHATQAVVVVLGTTLGLMLANVPVVFLGERIVRRLPVAMVHKAAAALFAVLGLATLAGLGEGLGL